MKFLITFSIFDNLILEIKHTLNRFNFEIRYLKGNFRYILSFICFPLIGKIYKKIREYLFIYRYINSLFNNHYKRYC
jgi:hypothetical protein